MYTCPMCKQSLAANEGACDWCAVQLAPGTHGVPEAVLPPIHPGRRIAIRDFTHAPLPTLSGRDFKWDDGDRTEAHHHGVLLTLNDGIRRFSEPYLRMRDGVVRLMFDVLDAKTRVRVVARKQDIGDAALWYELSLWCDERTFRLSRYFTSKHLSDGTELASGKHPVVRGVGETNVLELRVQGPTIEGWVNGSRVCATHDAALGIGAVAIAAGTDEKQRRILFRSFEVMEVAP
ncbi:MAG: hypothetical protein JST54_01700 [Deltaproteobacteria bacterium]|nr:hypothetical protein [Deltaproteobacteria bacterium]